ncbi:MAG: PhoU domain-containing protein [Pseudomonadota bacterium]
MNDFWRMLTSGESLIEDAKKDCVHMLDAGEEMFRIVANTLKELTDKDELEAVRRMDKTLNQEVRDVRKKVYQHLAISRGKDLVSGLQLITIVIDLERIGDYTKNLVELVEMIPAKMDFGAHESTYTTVHSKTLKMFALVRQAFVDDDEKKAREALSLYDDVSKTCDGTTREVIKGGSMDDNVTKPDLALVLFMRYMKRINAHLKNVATSIINPFHMIGFRPGAM